MHTQILGKTVDIGTIYVSGQIYEYKDGKVHLFSMKVQAVKHIECDVEITTPELYNDDGTFAAGTSEVIFSNLIIGDHHVLCCVDVWGEALTGGSYKTFMNFIIKRVQCHVCNFFKLLL